MNFEGNCHDCLYANLKMMGFGAHLRLTKNRTFQFNRDMFLKPNQKAFEHVSFFLFKAMKHNECLNELKACYPCKDKKQEADFRKILMKYLKRLESEKDFDHKFLPVLMHNPGGDQFVLLFICFTNYIIKKVLLKGLDLNDVGNNDLLVKKNQLAQTVKTIFDSLFDEKAQLLEGIDYFINKEKTIREQNRQSEEELRELNQKLVLNVGFCAPEQLMQRVSDKLTEIEQAVKPFEQLIDNMQQFLENEFKNEKLIVDVSKLSGSGQPLDLVAKYNCIWKQLDTLKSILQKDYDEIVLRKNELLTKNSMLGEIIDKLFKVNEQLADTKDQHRKHFEQHKIVYLAQDDVLARIERIKKQMNVNFPCLRFEPIAPEDEFETGLPKLTATSTIAKPKNRRVSIYDAEPSMIDFCDVSGYAFNPPSDQDFSFSPNTTRRGRISNIFDRNFGF